MRPLKASFYHARAAATLTLVLVLAAAGALDEAAIAEQNEDMSCAAAQAPLGKTSAALLQRLNRGGLTAVDTAHAMQEVPHPVPLEEKSRLTIAPEAVATAAAPGRLPASATLSPSSAFEAATGGSKVKSHETAAALSQIASNLQAASPSKQSQDPAEPSHRTPQSQQPSLASASPGSRFKDPEKQRLPPSFFQPEPPFAEPSDGIIEEAMGNPPSERDVDPVEAAIAHSIEAERERADDPMLDDSEQTKYEDLPEKVEVEPSHAASPLLQVAGVSVLLVVTLALASIKCGGSEGWRGSCPQGSAVRQRVEKIRVTTGATAQSMLASVADGSRGAGSTGAQAAVSARDVVSPAASPCDPDGVVLRLQGKIVAKAEAGALVAPFSGRPCVLYSASASRRRDSNDGVHPPPTAFHSASVDFAVQLLGGGPDLFVDVHSQDVSLFDMAAGCFATKHTFAAASDAWRGFVLAHLTMDKDGTNHSTSHMDVNAQGQLEFCECALVTGALVTCVGEIARDRNGRLGLYPWRPKLVATDETKTAGQWQLGGPWLGNAIPFVATPSSAARSDGEEPWEPLAGHVLISDDPKLRAGP